MWCPVGDVRTTVAVGGSDDAAASSLVMTAVLGSRRLFCAAQCTHSKTAATKRGLLNRQGEHSSEIRLERNPNGDLDEMDVRSQPTWSAEVSAMLIGKLSCLGKPLRKLQLTDWIALVALAVYVVAFSWMTIRQHNGFRTSALDLAKFDQMIWNASRVNRPYSTLT